MSAKPKIIVSDRVYIPSNDIDLEDVEKRYARRLYSEGDCRKCDNRSQRHNYLCEECPAYQGHLILHKEKMFGSKQYVGIPLGDRAKLKELFDIDVRDYRIVDKRVYAEFDYKIKTTLKPRKHQKKSIRKWRERKYGILKAPPRSGKTPTMLMISIKEGQRTLMLASQKEFLDQFLDHVEKYTNLPKLQERTGKRLYGYIKNEKDLEDLQIAVSPYQKFISAKGKVLWKKVRKHFGLLWVDEGHKGNAKEFATILNSSTARLRGAVTATDKRKDGRHYIMDQIIGPVVSKIKVPQMQAKIIIQIMDFVKTRSAYKGKAGWSYCMRFLANHEKRNKFMLDMIGKDLEAGHNIVLPLYTKEHIFLITRMINSIYGKGTAESFTGDRTCDRDAVLDRARSGKTRVVVGVRSLLQLGLNVPAWTCLYYFMPMNNEPNWYQESSRILTPEEGKKTPIIRMFVDSEIKLVLGCWANTYKQTLKFKHKPTELAKERAATLFKKLGGRHEAYDPDELDDDAMTPVATKLKQPVTLGLFRRK